MSSKSPTAVTVEPVRYTALPDVDYGVSYFEDRKSFVVYESGYEHVVLPDGRTVTFKPSWDDADLITIAGQLDDNQAPVTAPIEQPAPPAVEPQAESAAEPDEEPASLDRPLTRKESAWDRLCRGDLESMTDGDYFLVMTTEMPSMFEDWCNRREAFSQLK
ncbi:hypothetical protein AQ621_16915 (plasmid) [Marinobacter sp. P4B1]|nr:hypothetical protein AQ621_16915 [Marinobacter sp. P4B1]